MNRLRLDDNDRDDSIFFALLNVIDGGGGGGGETMPERKMDNKKNIDRQTEINAALNRIIEMDDLREKHRGGLTPLRYTNSQLEDELQTWK